MKKTIKLLSVLLCILFALSLCSCSKEATKNDEKQITTTTTTQTTSSPSLWDDATYKENQEFGEGDTKVTVEVKIEDKSVDFVINTDEKMLGDALLEHKLVEGEEGQYGLYIKKVNGVLADYDTDGAYWAFYIDGEYATTGVDSTEIKNEGHYELVYTKE